MRKIVMLMAAWIAAVGVFVGLTIQPRRLRLGAPADGTIAGVIHIHTSRSDGSLAPDEIAAAAARAGLQFIVFTDHGDGTRKPDAPAYRSGVLCLDGVEISTTGGHYIALDLPPAPYPLGGEARDVVEDVRRLGGFGIVAHPDSPKPELRWREWDAPFDAIEMVNPDTGWRVQAQQAGWRPRLRLLAALVDYPFRPAETITGLLAEDVTLPARWAAIAERRPVVTVVGADAHARLALPNSDPGDGGFALPLPGYEPSFRVLSVRVRPERPLSGVAAVDAPGVIRAIRAGHLHSIVNGIASPGWLDFTATSSSGIALEGDELQLRQIHGSDPRGGPPGGPVVLRVRTNAPPPFTTSVWNGAKVVSGDHHEQEFTLTVADAPAAYWVEIRSTGRSRDLGWIRSNAIYVRGSGAPAASGEGRPPVTGSQPMFDGATADGWSVEHDPTSLAALDLAPAVGRNELRLRFGLSNQITPAPVVALAYATPAGLAGHSAIALTVRAERPMRVSVQLRVPGKGSEWERWQRSMFVDVSDEDRTLSFSDFRPVGGFQSTALPLEAVRSIMFVIDPVNTKRGTSSRFWIARATLQR